MNQPNRQALHIEPLGPADVPAALELVFAHLEPQQRARRVAKLRAQCEKGPIEGFWAAYRGGRIVGAMRAAVQPGRTALVTAAHVVAGEPPETARALLARVVDALPGQGVQLAQALLETDHGPDAQLLAGAGFRHASDLLYLVSVTGAFPDSPPAEHLEFVPYSPERHRRLAQLVERTYAGSLDCRAVDGVRDVDDVLAGYQAAGRFDPACWLLVRHESVDVGCLLISPDAETDEWELTYMGVVPEARRGGFALAMTRHAQWLARNAACRRLVLAVDAGNAPAIATYAAAGFVTWDRLSVFLRVF